MCALVPVTGVASCRCGGSWGAGRVDPETGVVRSAPSLDWREAPLRECLEDVLDLPVTVANDVRAITHGGWAYGAGRGTDNLVVVSVGTGIGGGIGGGIVNDGHVLEGGQGLAGERR